VNVQVVELVLLFALKTVSHLSMMKKGFFILLAGDNCINCGKCYNVCPVINRQNKELSDFKQFCVAARHKNNSIWEKSASGGAFTAICQAYCKNGDAIFGAKFEKLRVIHDCVYSPNDIDCFRKSKYVQSDLGDSYKKIKITLEGNHKVLFSGTPCQVAGVKNFLGKEYENLFCIDIVCHGVGSPGIFSKYIEFLEEKHKSKVYSFMFRHKKVKMGRLLQHIIVIELENGKRLENEKDLYNTAFIQALFLRPSCGECKFASLNRVGDITIADFKKKHELLPNAKGLDNFSTVIINTPKGAAVFEKLQEFMEIYPVEIKDVVKENPPLRLPSKMNEKREYFYRDLQNGVPIEHALKKYITVPRLDKRIWILLPDRVRGIIKRRIKWIKSLLS
jgi:coenzyme F420-reducing hydrogenase beta subunit